MDPDLQGASCASLRTVYPHETNETGTPDKTPSLKWGESSWAERLLYSCSPRVGVLDLWPSAAVASAATTFGIPYQCVSSLKWEDAGPYDCVLSRLPKQSYALSFCYLALRAWASLLPGGHMVLVMKEAAYCAIRRFLPSSPLQGTVPHGRVPHGRVPHGRVPHGRSTCDATTKRDREDAVFTAYLWRKPLYKMVGNKTRHKARSPAAH